MRSAHPQGVGGASAGAGGLLVLTRSSQGRPVKRLARPAGRKAEDSGLLTALPPVTWTTGGGQNGRCPYRHAPLVGPKGQNPRGYNHGGLPDHFLINPRPTP